jgi:hypothetical protein
MRRRRDAVSGMWVRWRRALIWRARGVRGRILALHPLLDPRLLDGHRSPGRRRWWTNATLSYLAAGDYMQEGLGDLMND